MPSLELYIGRSKYTVDCEDSQKEKITSLARRLNERVNKLSLKIRGADEKTILMLCAINIEEELESAKAASTIQNSHNNIILDQKDLISEDVYLALENLANKIKNY